MKKWIIFLPCAAFWPSGAQGQSPAVTNKVSLPVGSPEAPDPAATLISKIIARNLFQLTRGSLPGGQVAAEGQVMPRLLGTMLRSKHRSALLIWPDETEGRTLEEGEEWHGARLVKVSGNSVELKDLQSKTSHVLHLDGEDAGSRGPDSEYAGLLTTREKASAPAAAPMKQE